MARPRQPVQLVVAKGNAHIGENEIKKRLEQEVQPVDDNVIAPDFLTSKQKKEFDKIADQLRKLKVINETDADTLGRYIVANDFYINAIKQLRKPEIKNDYGQFEAWSKIQERYFKQCRQCANDLGLTISSRCRLVIPKTDNDTPKENKFKQFEKRIAGG